MKEKEEMEHGLSEVLIMVNKIIIDVNVKIRKLSERLGRIMIKHGKIDHMKTGLFSWLNDYTGIKDVIIQSYKEVIDTHNDTMKYFSLKGAYPNQVIMTEFANSIAEFSNLKIILNTLDDIIRGLLEDLWDDVYFEDAQKREIEAVMKDNIEKSKGLPMYG